MMRYWELKTDAPDDSAELYIFGDIDPWNHGDKDPNRNASEIVRALQGLKAKSLTVHINSYGGDVKEGLAIYNTIKNSGMKVTTICDGFACSIASVIFMAGTRRIMNDASLLMIHNPWTMAVGNAEDMRKQADDLDIIAQASVEAYKNSSALLDDEIHKLMDAETWILPEQALEYGFATEIQSKPEEGLRQSAFKSIMAALVKQDDDPGEVADEDIMAQLKSMDAKLDELVARGGQEQVDDPEEPEGPEEPDDEDTPKQKLTGFNLFF